MGDQLLHRSKNHHRANADHAGPSHPGKTTNVQQDGSQGSWDGKPYKGSAFGASPALVKQIEERLATEQRNITKIEQQLSHADQMRLPQAQHLVSAMEQHRGDIQMMLVKLPTGSPLMQRGFETLDGMTRVIDRLDAFIRAHEAKAATSSDAAKDNNDGLFAEAKDRFKPGFCDTAPQQQSPCELDPATRERYRRNIGLVINTMQTNWLAAINALKVEEKFRKNEVPFAAVLGELLLGVLFNGLTAIGKAAASKGLTKLATTTERIESAGIVMTHVSEDLELVKKIADTAIDKGAEKAKAKLTEGGKTVAQVVAESQAGIVVPNDRDAFLQMMKSAPGGWFANISSNIDYLFDADLAALAVGLPKAEEITQPVYEAKVTALLKRYEEQVLTLDSLSPQRLMLVVMPSGDVRQALIAPEKQPSHHLHGEWKDSLVKTGKWTFVRWIDADMRSMAVTRAMSREVTAAAQVRMANDVSFWDNASLEQFKSPAKDPSQ